MEKLLKEMSAYCTETNHRNKIMHKALVEFVDKAGGEIDTSNKDNINDNVYAYVFNEFAEAYSDFKVDKVRVSNGQLLIHLSDYYTECESDEWFSVMGGMCIVNATLYSLCEYLHEYVDFKK